MPDDVWIIIAKACDIASRENFSKAMKRPYGPFQLLKERLSIKLEFPRPGEWQQHKIHLEPRGSLLRYIIGSNTKTTTYFFLKQGHYHYDYYIDENSKFVYGGCSWFRTSLLDERRIEDIEEFFSMVHTYIDQANKQRHHRDVCRRGSNFVTDQRGNTAL